MHACDLKMSGKLFRFVLRSAMDFLSFRQMGEPFVCAPVKNAAYDAILNWDKVQCPSSYTG